MAISFIADERNKPYDTLSTIHRYLQRSAKLWLLTWCTQPHILFYFFILLYIFLAFNLFVGSAWSFGFSSPPQLPMTSVFEGFLYQILSITFIFLSYFLGKSQYFPLWMFSAKQWNYWYHFYNVFDMTRSLTVDWNQDLPHSTPHYTTRLSRRR